MRLPGLGLVGAGFSVVGATSFLLVACAASTPSPPVAATPAPPPRVTAAPVASRPPLAAPTPPVGLPTPEATAPLPTPGGEQRPVQESEAVSALLRYMVQFGDRLQALAAYEPGASDLVGVSQEMSQLFSRLRQQVGTMSASERAQALWNTGFLLGEIRRVTQAYASGTNEAGPTVAGGTPEPASGTLLMVLQGIVPAAPPAALPTTAQQLQDQIGLIRQRAVQASGGRTSGEETIILLRSLEASTTTVYQQAPILSPQDLAGLMAAQEAAMQQITVAIRAYTGQ